MSNIIKSLALHVSELTRLQATQQIIVALASLALVGLATAARGAPDRFADEVLTDGPVGGACTNFRREAERKPQGKPAPKPDFVLTIIKCQS